MFIYIAEIANHDGLFGLCIFIQMILIVLQSCSSNYLMNEVLGVDGLFFAFGIIQIIALVIFSFTLKETQGLKPAEKKVLYTP